MICMDFKSLDILHISVVYSRIRPFKQCNHKGTAL